MGNVSVEVITSSFLCRHLTFFLGFFLAFSPLLSSTFFFCLLNNLLHILPLYFSLSLLPVFSISGFSSQDMYTQTLLLWSYATVIAPVCTWALSCSNMQELHRKSCHLGGTTCCSETCIYLWVLLPKFNPPLQFLASWLYCPDGMYPTAHQHFSVIATNLLIPIKWQQPNKNLVIAIWSFL